VIFKSTIYRETNKDDLPAGSVAYMSDPGYIIEDQDAIALNHHQRNTSITYSFSKGNHPCVKQGKETQNGKIKFSKRSKQKQDGEQTFEFSSGQIQHRIKKRWIFMEMFVVCFVELSNGQSPSCGEWIMCHKCGKWYHELRFGSQSVK
jgi:hypothetical protein